MKTLKKIITVLTLSTLGFAFTASAGPITLWDWQVDSAFTAFAPGTVTGTDNNAFWTAPTHLAWGTSTGQGQSSIGLSGGTNGMTTGNNLANGDLALTTTLVHNNVPITGDSLSSASLSTRLLLDPSPQAGAFDVTPFPLVFTIDFLETFNQEPCAADSPDGNPCNDIFVIDPVSNLNQMFTAMGGHYNIELIVDGLTVLTNSACQAAGAANGCSGFTTIEGQENFFDVNMRITAVPEPSTILLLSLAMFGIVTSMRSKRI